jgi:hypothetical protein
MQAKKPAPEGTDCGDAVPATAPVNDVAAALLAVLRSVDRQAAAALPLDLSEEALAAVARFRDISAALNVNPAGFRRSAGTAARA